MLPRWRLFTLLTRIHCKRYCNSYFLVAIYGA